MRFQDSSKAFHGVFREFQEVFPRGFVGFYFIFIIVNLNLKLILHFV